MLNLQMSIEMCDTCKKWQDVNFYWKIIEMVCKKSYFYGHDIVIEMCVLVSL